MRARAVQYYTSTFQYTDFFISLSLPSPAACEKAAKEKSGAAAGRSWRSRSLKSRTMTEKRERKTDDFTRLEVHGEGDSKYAVLTLCRPKTLNSVRTRDCDEVLRRLEEIQHNKSIRALIVTGKGRAFCAGADLSGGAHEDDPKDLSMGAKIYYDMDFRWNPMLDALYSLPIPVVSAVNGVAAGGGVGIALNADIVVASESAKFVQTFAPNLGLVPDLGSSWHVPKGVGRAKAMAWAMLGDKISAAEAERCGLIYKVVPPEDVLPVAHKIAKKLAMGPTHAFIAIRRLIDGCDKVSYSEQLEKERHAQRIMGDAASFLDAVMAFFRRKSPNFKRDDAALELVSKL